MLALMRRVRLRQIISGLGLSVAGRKNTNSANQMGSRDGENASHDTVGTRWSPSGRASECASASSGYTEGNVPSSFPCGRLYAWKSLRYSRPLGCTREGDARGRRCGERPRRSCTS